LDLPFFFVVFWGLSSGVFFFNWRPPPRSNSPWNPRSDTSPRTFFVGPPPPWGENLAFGCFSSAGTWTRLSPLRPRKEKKSRPVLDRQKIPHPPMGKEIPPTQPKCFFWPTPPPGAFHPTPALMFSPRVGAKRPPPPTLPPFGTILPRSLPPPPPEISPKNGGVRRVPPPPFLPKRARMGFWGLGLGVVGGVPPFWFFLFGGPRAPPPEGIFPPMPKAPPHWQTSPGGGARHNWGPWRVFFFLFGRRGS